ncbi:MAG: CopG family transcriptional regulator [Gemmatimonadales bacterium]
MQHMKDSHVTLRLPAELARALVRRAREAGVAKSHLVREAVTAYIRGRPAPVRPTLTAAELAERWPTLPRLTPGEASAFADDVAAARTALPPPPAPWE